MMEKSLSSEARFKAPLGSLSWIATIIGLIVLCGTAFILTGLIQEDVRWRLLAGAIPVFLLAGTWLFAVRGYAVDGETLYVKRPFWSTKVSLNGLQSVRHEPNVMRGSIRVLGNGGLFAFSGWYRNRALGFYRAWVTDFNRCVVLRLPRRIVVISPDDPKRFESFLARSIGKLDGR